jgi:EAL domain-containing protein (putative c-di-GMP-specific phosphodiesterase class I)
MLLQQIVNHFNDRFAQEQGFNFCPFILQAGAVSGLFGKKRLNSVLTPLRSIKNPHLILGHTAKIVTTTNFFHQQQTVDIENLLSGEPGLHSVSLNSIINFDRLCRTVHLLNFMNLSHTDSLLFLEVDPRHIIGIKHNHGAYFEEIIIECGLQTKNVVISLAASGIQQTHHDLLLRGLNNYRECGYKVALNVGHLISAEPVLNLIKALAPDYVSVSAPYRTAARLNPSLSSALQNLTRLVCSLEGQTILQEINQAEQALVAAQVGIDLVQGKVYEKTPDIAFDVEQITQEFDSYSTAA